jgi:VIT1/CCC1 family predicted Fe2+/Mn2+ transporter
MAHQTSISQRKRDKMPTEYSDELMMELLKKHCPAEKWIKYDIYDYSDSEIDQLLEFHGCYDHEDGETCNEVIPRLRLAVRGLDSIGISRAIDESGVKAIEVHSPWDIDYAGRCSHVDQHNESVDTVWKLEYLFDLMKWTRKTDHGRVVWIRP